MTNNKRLYCISQ